MRNIARLKMVLACMLYHLSLCWPCDNRGGSQYRCHVAKEAPRKRFCTALFIYILQGQGSLLVISGLCQLWLNGRGASRWLWCRVVWVLPFESGSEDQSEAARHDRRVFRSGYKDDMIFLLVQLLSYRCLLGTWSNYWAHYSREFARSTYPWHPFPTWSTYIQSKWRLFSSLFVSA